MKRYTNQPVSNYVYITSC